MSSTTGRAREGRQPWPTRNADAGPTHLLAFDCETAVDDRLIPRDWDASKFPKHLWHRVVAISVATALIVRDEGTGREYYEALSVRSGGRPDWDEARLIAGFWALLGSEPYKLVSYNGARFDLGVLVARSLLHGLDASVLWSRGDRWNGYLARNSDVWHLDLLQAVTLFGATSPPTLDELAAALRLPGKMGEHGGGVAAMVEAGDLDRVRRYCDADAANTLAAAYNWARTTGRLDEDGYKRSVESLRTLLESSPGQTPHLAQFSARWREVEKGRALAPAGESADGRIPINAGPPSPQNGV